MIDKPFTLFSDEEFEELVLRVAARIQGNQISSLIPTEVGNWLKENSFGYQQFMTFFMPLKGGEALVFDTYVNVDGTLTIKISDTGRMKFWEGTLKALDQ